MAIGSDSLSARTLNSATHCARAQENTKWMDGGIRLQRRSAPSTTPVSNRWYNATLGRPAARAFFVRDSRSGRERTERSVESTSTPKQANSGFGPRRRDALHWSFKWSTHPFFQAVHRGDTASREPPSMKTSVRSTELLAAGWHVHTQASPRFGYDTRRHPTSSRCAEQET